MKKNLLETQFGLTAHLNQLAIFGMHFCEVSLLHYPGSRNYPFFRPEFLHRYPFFALWKHLSEKKHLKTHIKSRRNMGVGIGEEVKGKKHMGEHVSESSEEHSVSELGEAKVSE